MKTCTPEFEGKVCSYDATRHTCMGGSACASALANLQVTKEHSGSRRLIVESTVAIDIDFLDALREELINNDFSKLGHKGHWVASCWRDGSIVVQRPRTHAVCRDVPPHTTEEKRSTAVAPMNDTDVSQASGACSRLKCGVKSATDALLGAKLRG
eukprot:scaffold162443_cov33-Tisochrysis_lutea.AAC.2